MSDVAFIVLTIAVFAVLALAVRGVERLVGSPLDSDRADLPGVGDGPEYGTERPRDHSSVGSRGTVAGVGAGRVGGVTDGQVAR